MNRRKLGSLQDSREEIMGILAGEVEDLPTYLLYCLRLPYILCSLATVPRATSALCRLIYIGYKGIGNWIDYLQVECLHLVKICV